MLASTNGSIQYPAFLRYTPIFVYKREYSRGHSSLWRTYHYHHDLPVCKSRRAQAARHVSSRIAWRGILALILLTSLLVLGAELTQHNIYVTYILAQKINIGGFLQRIEALSAIAWLVSTYFKTSLYTFGFILGLAQLFRLKSYQPLILPTTILLFGMAIVLSPDVLFYTSGVIYPWFYWDITVSIVIPLCLIIVYLIKDRFKQRNSPNVFRK